MEKTEEICVACLKHGICLEAQTSLQFLCMDAYKVNQMDKQLWRCWYYHFYTLLGQYLESSVSVNRKET